MEYYKFGMAGEPVKPDQNHPDFEVLFKSSQSDTENPNPYGEAFFDDPNAMANLYNKSEMRDSTDRITSIPSPYARMHITDLAFRELNAGSSTMSENDMKSKAIYKDYLHAMSHCLDMYELFYYFDDLDLKEKGILIEKVNLVTPNDPKAKGFLDNNPQTKNYLETLQLFRNQYMAVINERKKSSTNYKFNFDALYVFRVGENKTVFGATSPFTGFFAKSTCNVLTDDEQEPRLVVNKNGYIHKLLTNNEADWLTLSDRPKDFQRFMYLLLHQNNENLGIIFHNLFKTVEMALGNDVEALKNISFKDEYPEFNFGTEGLPKILSEKEAYLRTNNLDRSCLKYMLYLYLKNPIDFNIPQKAYKKPIDQREFPDGSGKTVPWICVNDLLSDALFVLPYDVNERYVAVPYYDKETKKNYRRCLLPIKQKVLEYFPDQSLSDIAKNLNITRYEDGHFVVNYNVKMDQKGKNDKPVFITLRREYKPGSYKYPDGKLIGPDEMENFAFGVYPFVRSSRFTNIYKVLFYNKFNLKIKNNNPEFRLDFFYFNDRKIPCQFKTESVKENYTGVYDPQFPAETMNSIYYSIQEENETNKTKCIEFVELSMDIKDDLGKKIEDAEATCLIVPLLERKETKDEQKTYIAIDLGTSNTYIAYKREGEAPSEINTIHVGKDGKQYSELQFMNVNTTSVDYEGVIEKYAHDLYLRPNQEPQKDDGESPEQFSKRLKRSWTACMPTQFCEFIPAHIVPRKEVQRGFSGNFEGRKGDGFSFPIPTVINCLRENDNPSKVEEDAFDTVLANHQPLTHNSIPFAYYEIGIRQHGDSVAEGDFKWCMDGNRRVHKNEVNLAMFISELLFIVRSNMLSEGFSLDQCILYWTYPLSFNDKLRNASIDIWNQAYKKYFITGNDITNEEMQKKVKYTNESLSPFYECVQKADQADFTVLMDIGGGSTDIIGYDNESTRFITSFEFAGNALYLNSKRNHAYSKDEVNVFTYYLNKSDNCKDMKNCQKNSYFGDATRLITDTLNANNGLAALMNYGFQMYERDFKLLFEEKEIQFLLKFYASSIVYHTAQLCHWYSKQQANEPNGKLILPHFIYLTGNGSKLFDLLGNNERDNLFKTVFMKVYEIDKIGEDELCIKPQKNPKVATARGALKAPEKVFNQVPNERVILLGDETTIKKPPFEVKLNENRDEMLKNVRSNVRKFINVFYDYLDTDYPTMDKDTVLKQIEAVEKEKSAFSIGSNISDSLFFLYIARIMEKISARIVEKLPS